MNENAIEDIIKKVMEQLNGQASSAPAASGACTASKPNTNDTIPVELSARHVHLSEEDAMELFGGPLTKVRDLSQPGQFLCKERVRLIGPKGVMDNIAVLGPARSSSQVEISKTDARALGVNAPVRESGDISGTPGIILASQKGIVGLEEGVLVARRHIHMTPADAEKFGVADKELVSVHIDSERPVVLEDVLIRVSDKFSLAMHIDLDEGNGSGWTKNMVGRIIAKKNCC